MSDYLSDDVLHIAIDVSRAEDEIHGQVDDGVTQPTPFSGWLGLIGRLDEILGPPSPTTRARDDVRTPPEEGQP